MSGATAGTQYCVVCVLWRAELYNILLHWQVGQAGGIFRVYILIGHTNITADIPTAAHTAGSFSVLRGASLRHNNSSVLAAQLGINIIRPLPLLGCSVTRCKYSC